MGLSRREDVAECFLLYVALRYRRDRIPEDLAAKIETTIQDCYGLQTQLSNVVFNESGTSIVGVSNDGDAFAWRT